MLTSRCCLTSPHLACARTCRVYPRVFLTYLRQERSNHSRFPPPTGRPRRRGVPRTKSIFLLKKKAKWAVHVNTAACALLQEVKEWGEHCTSLDYGEGGGGMRGGEKAGVWGQDGEGIK